MALQAAGKTHEAAAALEQALDQYECKKNLAAVAQALLKRLADRYSEVLEAQRHILREAAEAREGRRSTRRALCSFSRTQRTR